MGGKAGHGQVLYDKGGPDGLRTEQTCQFFGYTGLDYD